MKRIAVVLFAVVVGVVSFAGSANAVGNGTLGIRPANESDFIHVTLVGGSAQHEMAIVSNRTNAPVTLLDYPVDAIETSAGDFAFAAQSSKPVSLGSWITLASPTITLPAHTERNVPFTVTVPDGTLPGDYAGGLIIQSPPVKGTAALATNGAVTRMDVIQRQGLRVYLKVAGVATQKLAAGTLTWSQNNDTMSFAVLLRNTGNTILHPQATLLRTGMFGLTHRVNFVTPQNLLPGSSVTMHGSMNGSPGGDNGEATLVLKSEAGTQTQHVHILYAPWQLIAGAALLIALLTLAGWGGTRFVRKARAAIKEVARTGPTPTGRGRRRRMQLAAMLSVGVISIGLVSYAQTSQAASATQTVPMGTAQNFSVFGGTLSSTGATQLGHDLGVSPATTVSGFPPGTTNGAIHLNDSTATQGLTDLQTAYKSAAARTATGTLAGDISGRTLTTGVYYAAAAIALTGTLTFDAAGDSTAIFIVQINAAVNMAAQSQMVLANGAQASNIFWQINGALTVGAGAIYTGIVLGNAAITLGASTSVNGAMLTSAGAVTLAANTINMALATTTGTLTATIASATITGTTLTASGTQLATGQSTSWSVQDTRGTNAAWSLTVTASIPTSAAGTIDTTARTIPLTNLSMKAGTITADSGSGSGIITTTNLTLSGTPQALLNTSGQNNGTYRFTPTFTLVIPANAYRSNFAGSISAAQTNPYVSTLTVTTG